MPGFRTDEMPVEIAAVRDAVAAFTGTAADYEYLMVFDHEHGYVGRGAYQIALEGSSDWPYWFIPAVREGKIELPDYLRFEVGAGWYLVVYSDRPLHRVVTSALGSVRYCAACGHGGCED